MTLQTNSSDFDAIHNMAAGPEMDLLVAQEVMGYSVDFEVSPSGRGEAQRVWFIVTGGNQCHVSKIPTFSTDIKYAWIVGKKMQSRGHELSLQCQNVSGTGVAIWTACVGMTLARAASPSLAICRAALLALRSSEQTQTKVVPANLLSIIEYELAKIMGPIASLMVNDKITEFGECRDKFPKHRVDSFLKALTDEIGDTEGRAAFANAMTAFLFTRH